MGPRYMFPEGVGINKVHPYIIVANPTPAAASLRVRYKLDTDPPYTPPHEEAFSVPPWGRFSYPIEAKGSNFWASVESMDNPDVRVVMSTWSEKYDGMPVIVNGIVW